MRRTENELPFLYVGDEISLYLSLDEIAGKAAQAGEAQTGVFYFPTPLHLPARRRLLIEMFKTEANAKPKKVEICFVGYRVHEKRTQPHSFREKKARQLIFSLTPEASRKCEYETINRF